MLNLSSSRPLFITILILGNGLLLMPPGSWPRVAGTLILFLLPGLTWSDRWLRLTPFLPRLIIGAGLSYSMVIISGLILHYLPGPILFGAEVVIFNALALFPLLWPGGESTRHTKEHGLFSPPSCASSVLLGIILLAAFFRLASLGYSEFQGDEIKAMRPAAEALVGHQEALFLYRKKGPGEVLLPMVVWGFMGTINEFSARFPFAIAGVLLIPTTYLLGEQFLEDKRSGLVAAGLIALNGSMVAFSRVVQFPIIVAWISALALLCVWEWRKSLYHRWLVLAGIFLGIGLLAHYDIVVVIPALAYLALSHTQVGSLAGRSRTFVLVTLTVICCLLIIVGLFLLPYILNQQQTTQTIEYLKDRIGSGFTQNSLAIFLRSQVFYGSFYYLIITGLLGLGLPLWAFGRLAWFRRVPGSLYWVPWLALLLMLGLMIWPNTLLISGLDLAVLPFGLILLGACVSPVLSSGQRAIVIWLTIPFLIFNFFIAVPGAHTYTITPSWMLLAGFTAARVWDWVIEQRRTGKSTEIPFLTTIRPVESLRLFLHPATLMTTTLLLAVLFSGYLYNAYLRDDLEAGKQDRQQRQIPFYWSPYSKALGGFGVFGYAHQTGWKAIGALFANGQLNGDYGSNEQLEVTSWYIRDRLRSCDPQPKYFFAADASLGPWQLNSHIKLTGYQAVGRVSLPNNQGITIYQHDSPAETLGPVDANLLTAAFDHTATPAAFAYAHRESRRFNKHLAGAIRLVGYDLDILKAKPGGQLQVILYWQTQQHISADLHVFAHVESENGAATQILGQSNGRPTCQLYSTSAWQPHQLIPDPHLINLSLDAAPGEYAILAGMYNPDTGERLDVLDEAGQPVANFVKLTTVTIQ